MKIEIAGPVFKCEADENVFFSRLYSLKGYINVARNGFDLCLELNAESVEESVGELEEICTIWHTTFKLLD